MTTSPFLPYPRESFDAHCHLQDHRLDTVRDEIIDNAIKHGIRGCLTCGTAPNDWHCVASLKSRPDFDIRKAFGVHPWYVNELKSNWSDILRGFLFKYQDAAIGEIGLDAFRNGIPIGIQVDVLEKQLDIAAELCRPIVLHGVKALDELLGICRPYAERIPAIMVHAFAGSLEQLNSWLAIDAFISIGGSITRSARLREVAKHIPEDRLLYETDSPDMFPDEGTPAIPETRLNQPANLKHIITVHTHSTEIKRFE